MKRKTIIKFLNKACTELPVKKYQVAHKLGQGYFTDPEGNLYTEEMEKEGVSKRLVTKYIGDHERNHKRICLHIYDRFGVEGIIYYFRSYGINLLPSMNAPVAELGAQEKEIMQEEGLVSQEQKEG